MNGEIPSVPITTLAGVSSLVDLLPEMPLPTPLPQTLSNKSLLFHPRVAEEAQRLLSINDDNLIPQLIQSLCMTSSKHIELKDQYNEMPLDNPNAPRLLSGIIHRKPDVFKGKHVAEHMTDWSHNSQGQTNSQSQSQMYGMNNISGMSQQQSSQSQHQMMAGSSHMSMNPMDLQAPHHPGVMNSDSLHMMQSLDFISGLQPEQGTKNDRNAQDHSALHHSMYNSTPRSSSSTSTTSPGPGNSPFPVGMPQMSGYSPQLNLNHHSQVQQQQPMAHQSHSKASSSSTSSSMMHHQQQYPQLPQPLQSMSPSKTNSHSPYYGANILNTSASNSSPVGGGTGRPTIPHLPHLSNSIMGVSDLMGSGSPTNQAMSTSSNHQTMPMQLLSTHLITPPPSGRSASGSSASANFPSGQILNTNNSHLNNVPLSGSPHLNSGNVMDNINIPPSIAKISMNVPTLKIEQAVVNSGTPKTNNVDASNHTHILNQKELVLKLERNNDIQVQQALKKIERKDSTASEGQSGDTATTPRSGSGRKANNTSKQNYREETSEDDDGDDSGSPSKGRKGKIFKSKENVKDKRKKRDSKDSDYTGETMLSDTKKRKMSSQAAPEEAMEEPKKKVRRVERMLIPVLEKLGSTSNILDNSTYHRFLKTMDIVLESIDCADKSEIEMDDDGNVPSELLVSKSHMNELCSEAAKLKALGAMEAMPTEKIVKLLTLLEINIRDGCKVTPLADPEDNDEESRLWMELTMESISRGVVASLTSLHILTSPNMPKRTYLEDLIDRIVTFSKFQLQNTVFPTFDPVYRVRSKGNKDLGSSNKKKRAHAREVREKAMLTFYTKMHEVVGQLAELLNVQVLTDTTVLHLSTLGVSPFFVENVSELQLSSLKLVTGIFTHYDKHRRLLLDDILASIARLPSSKRSLRTFKLSAGSDENIQMLTALVLQLIQCVTHLPDKLSSNKKKLQSDPDGETPSEKQNNTDVDILISGRFDTAVRTAGNFLAVFLSKCGSKSEDCDYRVLFENFIQDLLSTVNKPEWPASELLLSLLGNLLVKNLGNKGLEVSMRVASLEYLGVAAARLRKDAVSAQRKLETIDRIIADIRAEDDSYRDGKQETFDLNNEEDKVEFLQRLLLDYLAVNGQSDPALMQSRHFYISSWWKTAQNDISKSIAADGSGSKAANRKKKKKKTTSSSGEESELSDDSDEEPEDSGPNSELNTRLLQLVERRRTFLLTKIRPFADPMMTSRKTEVVQTFVDYQSAELLTRYLASKRPFSASFDFFLTRILSVSTESTVAIRTKALKCLTMVVEADPGVLARHDMQLWVQNSFLDQSTAVREAAVDLVGKYVLSCPDLIEKYYDMLSLRILDTGVSVRKRVIKILRDICVEHPTFGKIPEICVKMIRRVNDEDGIRKLVMEVFQNMWFSPVKEEPLDTKSLLRKVSNITEVVASCEKVGLDFFEQLLLSLFKPKDEKNDDVREKVVNSEPPKIVLTASRQIVNCLVEHVLRLEENSEPVPGTGGSQPSASSSSSQRFVACVATLYLFAKIRPQLLVNHAITLEGYLSLRCQSPAEVQAIANIAAILELVVPLLVNPADSFLSQLEEDCVKLIFKNDKGVIESCLACLGAVINKITHNYSLVRDVFRKFQTILFTYSKYIREDLPDPKLNETRPRLRRAIYTIGMFLRYFDFMDHDVYGDLPPSTVNIIFCELMYLIDQPDVDLQIFSLQAVGNLCIRHYDFMLGDELKRVYQGLLTSSAEIRLKTQALFNIQLYLTEEELRMIKQDQEWQKNAKLQDIKEMGDVTSGMASTIVQIYLKQILEAFLHRDISVRLAAVRVIQLVLQQGLVHPIQIVPYLICMSTDAEPGVSTTADKQLQEMEKKHPQFLQSQVLNGIKLSLQLQRILAGYAGGITNLVGFHGGNNSHSSEHLNSFLDEINLPLVRGYRVRPKEQPSALNGFLYSLLRSTKPQRRAIARSLLQQFDDQNRTRLADLLYYCDNLAYFPYQVIDEPLFIIHHVDIVISVTGSNLLQSFKESLIPINPPQQPPPPVMHLVEELLPGEIHPLENGDALDPLISIMQNAAINPAPDDDDEDDDIEGMLKRIPEDTRNLEDCITGAQGVLLLLMLKQHLKEMYALNDAKISSYSPSDASKAFERPVNRKNAHVFEPKCTLANLQCPPSGHTPEGRRALVEQYIHFKQLMLRIDPEEGDEDGEAKPVKLKIDQNLFTFSNAKTSNSTGNNIPTNNDQMTVLASQNAYHQPTSHYNSSSNYGVVGQPQYAVVSNSPQVKQQVEPVRIPKLKIVPLAFPGNDNSNSPKKAYKVKDKEHHHHHKHKKSKHKKKKRHAISDDSDSDNSDDPDFRL